MRIQVHPLAEITSQKRAWGPIFRPAYPYLAVWLLAGCMGLYMKWEILSHDGFRCVARALGRTEAAGGPMSRAYLFSLLERLSFFRADLLVQFVALPLAGALLLYWVGRRWRMAVVAGITSACICFLYLQIHGYWFVGQFQSWQLWHDSFRWSLHHPADFGTYLGWGSFLKLAVALILPAAAGALALRWQKKGHSGARLADVLAVTVVSVVLAATATAWCGGMAGTAYHRSALVTCMRAFMNIDDENVARYSGLTAQQVMARMRQATHSPAPEADPRYFASAKDYDVICFVLETAPARCLDVDGALENMPNLKRLRQQAWVCPNHLSTYPYTSYALFSLVTSWYPNSIGCFDHGDKPAPGLMQSLRHSGYVTAAYKPFVDNGEEEARQHAAGITTIYHADDDLHDCQQPAAKPWQEVVQRDRLALEQMKKDIAGWAATNQRYAVMFLPQIGHGPWPDIINDGGPHDVVSRGKALIELQDEYLGELVTALAAAGRLDKTIILVTGDHGIRTRMEDPKFEGGLIDPYSYHVPFLLYAPQVLGQSEVIPWRTSHIDVAPSILDLLGVSKGREYEMGGAIWDSRLEGRTLFMWGRTYLGADGFCGGGQYCMWQSVSDMAYRNSAFGFKETRPLPPGSPGRQEVIDRLQDMAALQYRITRLGGGEG